MIGVVRSVVVVLRSLFPWISPFILSHNLFWWKAYACVWVCMHICTYSAMHHHHHISHMCAYAYACAIHTKYFASMNYIMHSFSFFRSFFLYLCKQTAIVRAFLLLLAISWMNHSKTWAHRVRQALIFEPIMYTYGHNIELCILFPHFVAAIVIVGWLVFMSSRLF